jgi:hypothetical protein
MTSPIRLEEYKRPGIISEVSSSKSCQIIGCHNFSSFQSLSHSISIDTMAFFPRMKLLGHESDQ